MIADYTGALSDVKVVEVGQLLAGPFAGTLLGYFGASVIKVEPPEGDPLRSWRALDSDGTSLWWKSLSRNKRCVVFDLRTPEGQGLLRELVTSWADVLIENFRPGTMERWGLGPDTLLEQSPGLIYVRVSGFGQSGPGKGRAGFASVCEAVAGLRHLTAEPGQAPVRANLSLGDTLGGLHAMIGLLVALHHQRRTGKGQVVDIALTESVLNVLESVLIEQDRMGIVRGPSGGTITGVVPSNVYRCSDGVLVLGANTDKLFRTLMSTIGRADMAEDPGLASNPGRVARAAEIDAAIGEWTRALTVSDALLRLEQAGIPAGPVNDAASICGDAHFAARGLFDQVAGNERLPKLWPRLEATPGLSAWQGPPLGAHTTEVLEQVLGCSSERVEALAARGVIRR